MGRMEFPSADSRKNVNASAGRRNLSLSSATSWFHESRTVRAHTGSTRVRRNVQVEFSKKNPTQNPTHQVDSHQPDRQDFDKSLAIKGLLQRNQLEQRVESLFESVGWRFEPSPASFGPQSNEAQSS
jgi:CMP-N-acetylneuraminic acid synthetase